MQDTLYLHYGKQYLKDCYIEGSVDFIFGNSTALLEHCHIYCKSTGFITAQSRKSSQETTGYVFLRFVIIHLWLHIYFYLRCGTLAFNLLVNLWDHTLCLSCFPQISTVKGFDCNTQAYVCIHIDCDIFFFKL